MSKLAFCRSPFLSVLISTANLTVAIFVLCWVPHFYQICRFPPLSMEVYWWQQWLGACGDLCVIPHWTCIYRFPPTFKGSTYYCSVACSFAIWSRRFPFGFISIVQRAYFQIAPLLSGPFIGYFWFWRSDVADCHSLLIDCSYSCCCHLRKRALIGAVCRVWWSIC